jgi:hypothetical protein
MSKRTNGIPGILIMIFLFSSITVLQQGVLGLQPNQTSSKNITSQATPQGTSLGSNKTSAVSNATVATPAQTQPTPSSQSPSSSNGGAPMSSGTPNMTGFTNAANLTLKDKIFPIKYNITGGKLVGLLPDKDKTTLVAVLSPGGSGEKNMIFTIELPRNVIDSKGQGNTDTKFVVKIDNKGVEYKDLANNLNARILGIDFSKGDRVVEITGTQMTP